MGISSSIITIRTATELAKAIAAAPTEIVVEGTVTGTPPITVPPGITLSGGELVFAAQGVRLTRDNTLRDITITTPPHEVAVSNDTSVPDAGTLRLENVTTVGQVYLVAAGATTKIRVETDGLHVADADVRDRTERPHGYGVDVLQGGLTLWNQQPDPASSFTATLHGVSIGTPQTPVRGSGVFVAGHGDREGHLAGGALTADLIETGAVVTDGGIAPGTPDVISGGVFVVSGAIVDTVFDYGPVTTRGQNDMVLDNWGSVKRWIATAPVTSFGPSGIGFVNFGDIERLDVRAPILTTGQGARGFNLYDGTLQHAQFDSIRTTGDGSIGIQVSRPLGTLTVHGDVETSGGEGMSLVKGVQLTLKAVALSVKPGGAVRSITVGGALRTRGARVTTLEVEGPVDSLSVGGGIHADGAGSDCVRLTGEFVDLDGITLQGAEGHLVRHA